MFSKVSFIALAVLAAAGWLFAGLLLARGPATETACAPGGTIDVEGANLAIWRLNQGSELLDEIYQSYRLLDEPQDLAESLEFAEFRAARDAFFSGELRYYPQEHAAPMARFLRELLLPYLGQDSSPEVTDTLVHALELARWLESQTCESE